MLYNSIAHVFDMHRENAVSDNGSEFAGGELSSTTTQFYSQTITLCAVWPIENSSLNQMHGSLSENPTLVL